jgi:hypothetical protein
MAELHVGQGQQYATLARAGAAAGAGDVVVVHEGVYREVLRPPAGTMWIGETGAIIDGGWNREKMHPNEGTGRGVSILQPGVTVRGFEIRNVAGNGVSIGPGGDGATLANCEIHHTLNGALSTNGGGAPVRDVTVRQVYAHDISLSGRWYETPVNGCFLFKHAYDALIEECVIERGHGEGAAAGTRSKRVTFRRCRIGRTTHLLLYASNRAQDVLIEECVLYQLADEDEFRQRDGGIGHGIVVGDEVGANSEAGNWQHGENVTVRGCLVVNAGAGVTLRNRVKTVGGVPDGYDTTIQNLVVEGCTFVTGNNSSAGVSITENPRPGKSVRGTFRKNLFVFDQLAASGAALRNNAPGVTFDDNLWSGGVPASVPASNRPVAASALVAPFAPLGEFIDLDNYRPRAGGPLDGAGYGALEAAGTEPPPPDPDPDPEPEPVDWARLRTQAAAIGAELDALIALIDEYAA